MTNRLTFIVLLISNFSFSQIEIDKPIVFISATENNRTVEGLPATSSTYDLINADEVIMNKPFYASATINQDTLIADFDNNIFNYEVGLKIELKIPDSTNLFLKYLQVDTLNPILITRADGTTILQNDITPGSAYTLIYNGSSFTLLKRKEKECPQGFIEINNSYCIEIDESNADYFFEASVVCSNKNARLCTWAEWTYACINFSQELNSMTNNYEWVDSGSVTEDGARVTGSGSCFFNSSRRTGDHQINFRCCYNK